MQGRQEYGHKVAPHLGWAAKDSCLLPRLGDRSSADPVPPVLPPDHPDGERGGVAGGVTQHVFKPLVVPRDGLVVGWPVPPGQDDLHVGAGRQSHRKEVGGGLQEEGIDLAAREAAGDQGLVNAVDERISRKGSALLRMEAPHAHHAQSPVGAGGARQPHAWDKKLEVGSVVILGSEAFGRRARPVIRLANKRDEGLQAHPHDALDQPQPEQDAVDVAEPQAIAACVAARSRHGCGGGPARG
mmetsp:Transcript_26798/g.84064  ORF Transcript_26798/g.84064 Transcript_26798/m.84064 type:complete len:242 (+) Transcript_26798:394-1119(+)